MERPVKNAVREMEEWLAQLGMEMDKNPMTSMIQHDEENDGSERPDSFEEELAAVLGVGAGDQFNSLLSSVSGESNASNHNSPDLDMDYTTFLGVDDHFPSLSPDDINAISSNPHLFTTPQLPVHQSPSDSDSTAGVAATAKKARPTKRKREPNQIQDHILAERKRRELLSTQFISLSSILPGLKKTDKTSVLGEAIKYMKQLQEKVKTLEEVTAKQTVESVVVVKKSQIVVADDSYSSSVDDDGGDSLPEIEVKLSSEKSMLIKLCCQNHKGILPKLFQQLEDLNLNVVNSTVIPFGTFTFDITILVQLEREMNVDVKEVITSLRRAVRVQEIIG